MKTIYDMGKELVQMFGRKKQLDVVQEECGKLTEAIAHYKRGKKGSREEVEEEVANVAFMIYQLMYIFSINSGDIAYKITKKFRKLMKKEGEK